MTSPNRRNMKKWSYCNGWPIKVEKIKKMKIGLIVMGDLPRWDVWIKKTSLIVMGDLSKWKMVLL